MAALTPVEKAKRDEQKRLADELAAKRARRAEVVEHLRKLNPRKSEMDLGIYADLFLEYTLARDNIELHGPIVLHPRTGTPIDNPYIKIRDKAARSLRMLRIAAGDLWTR